MVGAIKTQVLVVAGVGNSTGTGAATARVFSKAGYHIACIGRFEAGLTKLSKEIAEDGGRAIPFRIENYSSEQLDSVWREIKRVFSSDKYVIRAALWNAVDGKWKPFLDTTPEEARKSLHINVEAACTFSRNAIKIFKDNNIDPANGARGSLFFTGNNASIRSEPTTSLISAGKAGARALSQSLAKEFGKHNIHVVHVLIASGILTGSAPDNGEPKVLPEDIGKTYLYLTNQPKSAWTWELDVRPPHFEW